MLKKKLKNLKVVVSMIVLNLLLTYKAVFASFILNKRGVMSYGVLAIALTGLIRNGSLVRL